MNTLIVNGFLAAFGLSAAYWAWTYEEPTGENAIELVDCDAQSFSKLTLDLESRTTTLEKRKNGYWVTVVNKASKDAEKKGKSDATTLVYPALVDIEDDFLKTSVTPLRAARSLGKIAKKSYKTLGLDKPAGSLVLNCGRTTTYKLGKAAYGSGDRAIKAKDGSVHLLSQAFMSKLETADTQLVQREFRTWDNTEVDAIEIHTAAGARTLKQLNRLDEKAAQWVDAAQPDKRNDLYSNWVSRVAQLRVSSFLEQGQTPGSDIDNASGDVEEVVKLTYKDARGNSLGDLELQRVPTTEKAPAVAPGMESEVPQPEPKTGYNYYARSTATKLWSRVARGVGDQIADDVASVLSGSAAN